MAFSQTAIRFLHMKNNGTAIFLLGGHDLEMFEIRRMLNSHSLAFEDRNLDWSNARLSAYCNFIDAHPDRFYYGIELVEDCDVPAHYVRIDHHNDFSSRPASILQVAALLDVVPDRYIQLVAANDAGYIPGMLKMGATENEIIDIRRRDRAAQGVTEEDELLAEESIEKGQTEINGVLVIHSFTSHFSAISDRLYPYHRLLIYTELEWTYYGEGKARLVEVFSADIRAGRVYHGGGDKGYIGSCRGAFSVTEILEFVNKIKQRYEHV